MQFLYRRTAQSRIVRELPLINLKGNMRPRRLDNERSKRKISLEGIGIVMILTNAFSLNMLGFFPASIQVEELSVGAAREYALSAESAVGHADTAAVFADCLGVPVEARRVTVSLQSGSELVVGQYIGPRLQEGATKLPEGATIKWLKVSVR